MNTFTISVKPSEPKGDMSFYQVDARKAKEIKDRWDAHQNIQIGDSYISWQRIVEITAPPATNRLEAAKFCSKCEQGWLFGDNGAYPCSCNANGKDEIAKYSDYLQTQKWYTDSVKRDDQARDKDSLIESATAMFN